MLMMLVMKGGKRPKDGPKDDPNETKDIPFELVGPKGTLPLSP